MASFGSQKTKHYLTSRIFNLINNVKFCHLHIVSVTKEDLTCTKVILSLKTVHVFQKEINKIGGRLHTTFFVLKK